MFLEENTYILQDPIDKGLSRHGDERKVMADEKRIIDDRAPDWLQFIPNIYQRKCPLDSAVGRSLTPEPIEP